MSTKENTFSTKETMGPGPNFGSMGPGPGSGRGQGLGPGPLGTGKENSAKTRPGKKNMYLYFMKYGCLRMCF